MSNQHKSDPRDYYNRGNIYKKLGLAEKAKADRAKAEELKNNK
jgi:hypothetical protein|tara:strand:+ start:228 stop:356 length:129 start_codon:yes stop_codon:yes gene_type:complete